MEDNYQKHIEIGPAIFKRVRITGKTLCRERQDGSRFTNIVDDKIVDDPFTIIHAEDVATGERYDFNIRHCTAKRLFLDHLIVNETLHPVNGNIFEYYSDKPELCKEYDAIFRWIPEGAEYKDKDGIWHKYRRCNRYKLEMAITVHTKEYSADELFEIMNGHSYDATNATPEDKGLYNELLDIVRAWKDKEE